MHACNGFLCNRVTGRQLSCEARLTHLAVWVSETRRPARIRQWVCLIALATAKNTVRQWFKLTSGLIPICPERYIVRSTTTAWLHEVWKTKQYRKKTEQEHLVTTAATFLISPNTAVGNELIKWLVKKGGVFTSYTHLTCRYRVLCIKMIPLLSCTCLYNNNI